MNLPVSDIVRPPHPQTFLALSAPLLTSKPATMTQSAHIYRVLYIHIYIYIYIYIYI